MNRELLEKPFAPEQIKQRDGNFGKVLDYVEGHAVIQRLNDAFDANWSFEILEHDVLKDTGEVIVLGKLTAENVVKTQFGSSLITRAKETGEIISLADDLKAAATDAIKKAATLLGVGLHLYNGDGSRREQGRQHSANDSNDRRRNSAHGNSGNPASSNREGNGRLSAKQHSYILNLIQQKGITRSELNKRCVQSYGAAVDYLSRADASSLIDELLNQ